MSDDPRSTWCRHYTAYPEKVCKVGITYSIPRPCIRGSSTWGECPHFEEYTSAELDEQERASNEAVASYLAKLNDGHCPHCDAAIVERKQIGRCVYANPCGHRLYQGKA